MRRGLISLLVISVAACGEAPTEYLYLEQYPNRQFVTTAWDTVGWIGPVSANDTVLVNPHALVTWDSFLVALDGPSTRLTVFTGNGRYLWSYSRFGAGPRELRQVSAAGPTPWGNLWVLDARNRKLLELDPSGNPVVEHSYLHFLVHPVGFRFTEDGVIFGTQSPRVGQILADLDSLRILAVRQSPWSEETDDQTNLAAARAADWDTGLWVEAQTFGPGFVVGRGSAEGTRYPYIDPIPWAQKGNPRLRELRADSARYGALSAALRDDRIYFLSGGRPYTYAHGPEPVVLIDVYEVGGSYLHSYLLPFDSRSMAVLDDGRFAILTMHEDILPRIFLLRPRAGD